MLRWLSGTAEPRAPGLSRAPRDHGDRSAVPSAIIPELERGPLSAAPPGVVFSIGAADIICLLMRETNSGTGMQQPRGLEN